MATFLKRVYEPREKTDGVRILVDRLWPRGVSKAEAHIDRWEKEVAPSTQLRQWFGHDPVKWSEFQEKYRLELKDNARLAQIKALSREEDVTLVYAAKDAQHSHALVLKKALDAKG